MNAAKYNPFVTARTRTELSSPMRRLFKLQLLKGKILDFGAGFGTDVKNLRLLGFDAVAYDRYNKKFNNPNLLEKTYDTVTCHYVFNVIASWEEFYKTLRVLETLGSNIYISVRTDKKAVKNDWIYDEELKGYWTSKSFQRFYTPNDVYAQFGKDVDILRVSGNYILFKLEG
jgi:hypothetical protein